MYLHELRRIIRKTGKDQIAQRKEANPERAQLFSPAEPVVSEYGFDIVFINGLTVVAAWFSTLHTGTSNAFIYFQF